MEYREARPVKQIVVKGAVDVMFLRGDNPVLRVDGDAKAIRSVNTTFIGDRLIVEREGITLNFANGSFTVFGSSIINMQAGGQQILTQGKVMLGIALPELLAFSLQGSGGALLYGLDQPDLRVDLEGSGKIGMTGQVGNLEIALRGSDEVKAASLLAEHGDLRISGTGNIAARIQSDVCSEISGNGNIAVYGNPFGRRQERVTGMGKIRYM